MQEINVKVAVRVRPQLDRELLNQEKKCVNVKPMTNEIILGMDRRFIFDNVFAEDTSQDEIFKICLEPLVGRCFEGYNATVLTYGQTGSGKTFTMGTKPVGITIHEEFGIIPRAVNRLFQIAEGLKDRLCTIRVTFLEIYRDELIDLLDIEMSKEICIREDPSGNTSVVGCLQVECSGMEDVMNKLWEGSMHRRTAVTQLNDQSSRSHAIFTIYIEQNHTLKDYADKISAFETKMAYTCAKFHFVDLAGSERANRTNNIDERFKESIHINTGLLALGNVISALSGQKKVHVPYRNSKITRVLKDSLGGNANTLMICCISPSASDFDETLNSLKYANRARNIKNRPIINRNPFQMEVKILKSEIEILKNELEHEKSKNNSCNQNEGNTFLQQQLQSLKQDCNKYYEMAKEAFKHIKLLQEKALLSQSFDGHLNEWMGVMDDLKHWDEMQLQGTYIGDSINKLQLEIKKKENEIMIKDGIISKQAMEIAELESCIKMLREDNACLNAKSINWDDGMKNNNKKIENYSFEEMDKSNITQIRPRAKSVPSQEIISKEFEGMVKDAERNICTSVNSLSVEKIGDILRLRTGYMASRLEDADEVSTYRESPSITLYEEETLLNEKKTSNRDTETGTVTTDEIDQLKLDGNVKQDENLKNNLMKLESKESIKNTKLEKINLKQKLQQGERNEKNGGTFMGAPEPEKHQHSKYPNDASKSLGNDRQQWEKKLITAKLKRVTDEEMRSVATTSCYWIEEQIDAHLKEKVYGYKCKCNQERSITKQANSNSLGGLLGSKFWTLTILLVFETFRWVFDAWNL